MHSEWQLQEAKSKFSQLVKRAASGEAQVVTVHGKPAAVIVAADQYARLTRRKGKLSDALLRPDLAIEDLDLTRSRDTGRNVDL
jgi:antitoxin Phd